MRNHTLALVSAACMLAMVTMLGACTQSAAPKSTDDTKVQTTAEQAASKDSTPEPEARANNSEDKTTEPNTATSPTSARDFTDRTTGMFPDVQTNDTYQNSGNRGCGACHGDLFDLDKNNGQYYHITNYVGMKDATYTGDCKSCHFLETGTAGNLLSENIHILHSSSKEFVEKNGTCWSCHIQVPAADGTVEMRLFDEVKYTAQFGGFRDTVKNPATIKWNQDRGWDTGLITGLSITNDPKIEVSFNQNSSDENAEFRIQNYQRLDGNDAYASIDPKTWKLEIKGADGTTSVTLDDIKEMPATERTLTQWCFVVGHNSAMVDNMPVKGVLLKDFVEAIGETEGNTLTMTCADGWACFGGSYGLQYLIDNDAMLVYENYGHDLTVPQGGPLKLMTPGTGGNVDEKNLVAISFDTKEQPTTFDAIVPRLYDAYNMVQVSSTWFQNDWVEGKVGQPLELEGAAFGWDCGALIHNVDKVLFSIDYGQNWAEYEVPDGFDPDQWARFDFTWTPDTAGTYVIQAKAVDQDGYEQPINSSIIVKIGE